MYHHNKEVSPVPIRVGLSRLFEFLNVDSCKKSVITGHNISSYDIPVLLNALRNCGIANTYYDKVHGICDTLQVFKASSPELKSYSQVNLYRHFLEEDYVAHDSLHDVIALNRLINHVNPDLEIKQKLTYSFESLKPKSTCHLSLSTNRFKSCLKRNVSYNCLKWFIFWASQACFL